MKRRFRAFGRETKRLSVDLDHVKLDGSFSGYASLFGEVDQGNDAVAKGAFTASLKARDASSVKMLFQHDPDQPIGVWQRIEEDEKGLFVEGRITRTTTRGAEVLELMRSGALDGLSIGFRTVKSRKDRAANVRWILAAELWEISIVTFPLLENARVQSVKSTPEGHVPTIREFERWLTRDAGLSRRDARLVIADGYGALHRKRDAALEMNLAEKIRKATHQLTIR